jgi:hypothetical protein
MRVLVAGAFVALGALAPPVSAGEPPTCRLPIYETRQDGQVFRLAATTRSNLTLSGRGLEIQFDRWFQNGTGRQYLSEVIGSDGKEGIRTELIELDEKSDLFGGPGPAPVLLLPDLVYEGYRNDRFSEETGYPPSSTWRLTGCTQP